MTLTQSRDLIFTSCSLPFSFLSKHAPFPPFKICALTEWEENKKQNIKGLLQRRSLEKIKSPWQFCSVAVCERRHSAHAGSILPSGVLVKMV